MNVTTPIHLVGPGRDDPAVLYDVMHRSHPLYQRANHGVFTSPEWLHLLKDPNGEIHDHFHRPSIKIVEFGCGNGILCEYLTKMNYDVTGVDIADSDIMYDRSKYEFIKMNLCETPYDFSDRQFDYAVSFDFMEHLPSDRVKSVLQEMCRVSNGVIMKVACSPEPLLHLTVKTPGWWLDKLIINCPDFTWRLLRNFQRVMPDGKIVYAPLFYGKRAPIVYYGSGRPRKHED